MSYFKHDTAIVDEGAVIGAGTKIWHWTHVSSGARIGDRCSLGQNVFVGSDVIIGSNVKIQNNVSIYDAVTLEDDVFCGPSMVFTNVINPRSHIVRKHEYRRTTVRRGATIGANATIICGNEVGSFSLIGAGSVVTRNVPCHALVIGTPARQIGWVCECAGRLRQSGSELTCELCSGRYELKDGTCVKSDKSSR